MKRPVRRLLFLATLAGSAAAAADASADPAGESSAQTALVNKLTDDGLALYSAHDYRRAVEKFMAAYAMDPDPNLLFNTARCYEQLGDVRAAIEKYENFLAEPGGDPNGRRKAEETLASLRKAKAGGSAARPASRDASHADTSSSSGRTSGPPWTTLGWISLSVGVAAGTAGTIVYLFGKSDQDQVTGTPGYGQAAKMQIANITQASAQELVDRGNTKKIIGEILWGTGGAALVGAVTFFLLRRGSAESSVSVGFAPTTGGGTATVGGRF
jgi:tetratricopeptide (TPR) repeat protein